MENENFWKLKERNKELEAFEMVIRNILFVHGKSLSEVQDKIKELSQNAFNYCPNCGRELK